MNTAAGQPIFLIGFMGCGKTTLGRALAASLGAPFIDIDDEILRRAHADSVNDIFAGIGEEGFRTLETQTIRDIAQSAINQPGASDTPCAVIACGGGTPCHGDNMDIMLDAGTVVWLDADEERLFQRLTLYGDSRPLVRGLDAAALRRFIHDTLAQRRQYYSRAQRRFDSSALEDAEQIAESVKRFVHTILQRQ